MNKNNYTLSDMLIERNKLADALSGFSIIHAEVCEQLKQKTDRFNELCKRYEEMRVKLQRLTALHWKR